MILESIDGKKFTISKSDFDICIYFSDFFENEDVSDDTVLKISYEKATGTMIAKVVDFCQYFSNNNDRPVFDKPLKKKFQDYVSDWYVNFFNMTDSETVQLANVVNYLNIPPLLEICVARLADMIRFKTTDQIRELFEIESDFTPEEEEKINKENQFIQNYVNN